MRAAMLDKESLGNVDLTKIFQNGDDWQVFDETSADDVSDRIRDAEIVLTNKVPLTAAALECSPQLKLIIVTATGTNNIDLECAHRMNITVSNIRAYGSASVAQHTLALMLNLATRMPDYLQGVQNGEWQNKHQFSLIHRPIFELAGKRLGIIGYGELGQTVAKLAEAFGMQILLGSSQKVTTHNRLPLHELLPQVDFLSLHCPVDKDNFQFMNQAAFDLMPTDSYLINTARGDLVDSTALITALKENKIAGAGLDTLPIEPPKDDDLLLTAQQQLPNLLITPHNAWGAIESRQRLMDQVLKILNLYHQGATYNVV